LTWEDEEWFLLGHFSVCSQEEDEPQWQLIAGTTTLFIVAVSFLITLKIIST